jgi:hypothetical protein
MNMGVLRESALDQCNYKIRSITILEITLKGFNLRLAKNSNAISYIGLFFLYINLIFINSKDNNLSVDCSYDHG